MKHDKSCDLLRRYRLPGGVRRLVACVNLVTMQTCVSAVAAPVTPQGTWVSSEVRSRPVAGPGLCSELRPVAWQTSAVAW